MVEWTEYIVRYNLTCYDIMVCFEETNGDLANLFHPEFLLNGKADDRMRKLVDNCDNVQGFVANHSVGGGTGSGLGASILERMVVDYRKKSKLGIEIYPSPTISNCVVEPYNALLATHWLLDHTDVSLMLDNEAIYGLCQKNLNIRRPSYI